MLRNSVSFMLQKNQSLEARSGEQPSDDGFLEAWEMRRLALNADLAILSACETARGRATRGEGVVGMTWALHAAGVPTTIVSQWGAESKSTATLMVELHRELRGGVPPAEALRRAQLKLMRDPRYRHPYYWAPFITVGAGQ